MPVRGVSSNLTVSKDCKDAVQLEEPGRHKACIYEHCDCSCHAGQEYLRGRWRKAKES